MIQILENPARFCISYKGKIHKIFSYFNAASDGGFAIHSYLKTQQLSQVHLGKDYHDKLIDISKMYRESFAIHKTNFHKSGKVVRKNKGGEKFKGEIHGKSLEEIPGAINLFYIQPTTISKYPEIDNKRYYHLDKEGSSIIPPVIQGILCQRSYDFRTKFMDKHIQGSYFIDKRILSKFNLNLFIYVRKHKDGTFPLAQVTGVFEY